MTKHHITVSHLLVNSASLFSHETPVWTLDIAGQLEEIGISRLSSEVVFLVTRSPSEQVVPAESSSQIAPHLSPRLEGGVGCMRCSPRWTLNSTATEIRPQKLYNKISLR
jgi:hypothetical protein